jgi:hypothetical protein
LKVAARLQIDVKSPAEQLEYFSSDNLLFPAFSFLQSTTRAIPSSLAAAPD